MTWTRKRPTVAGWYWYKERKQHPFIMKLIPDVGYDARRLVRDCEGHRYPLALYRGQWAGPIAIPK